MGIEALSELGKIAGIAGIAIGALVLIFSSVIQKKIFPNLDKEQAYKIIRMIVSFALILALVGVAAWVYLDVVKHERKQDATLVSKYVVGQVLSDAGDPIISANIEVSQDESFLDKSDGNGRFALELKGVGKKYFDVVITHKSYKTARQKVKIDFEADGDEVRVPDPIIMATSYPPDPEDVEPGQSEIERPGDPPGGRPYDDSDQPRVTRTSDASKAAITVNYMGDLYGCALELYITVGGVKFNPNGNSFRVSGIPLGSQNYSVSGSIDCGYSGQCNATGSGSLNIQNNAQYYVMWNMYTCNVGLYSQQDYNRLSGL